MRRFPEATPCPAPAPNLSFPNNRYHDYGRRSSVYGAARYMADDTTTMNLEYTTELQTQFRHAKPRRPMRRAPKATFDPSLDIFEDVAQEEEQQQQRQTFEARRKNRASILPPDVGEGKSAILARPTQKLLRPVAPPAPPPPAPPVQEPQVPRPHRRRVSQLLIDRQAADVNATVQLQEDVLEKQELKRQGPKKDPRRRTIYVPSDDTTIVTIHPGQPTHRPTRSTREKSPDLGLELVTLSEEEPDNLRSVMKKEKKAPRKSLALPPKRAPLGQSTRPIQGAGFAEDVFGKGGGKENVPPSFDRDDTSCFGKETKVFLTKDDKKPTTTMKPAKAKVHFASSKPASSAPQARSRLEGAQKRLRSQLSYDGSPAKSIKAKASVTAPTMARRAVTKSQPSSKVDRAALSSSPFHTDRSPPNALRRQRIKRGECVPTKITMMHVVGKPHEPREKYPVLADDLARPELYEDHWLTYQEVAITQLLNSLFDDAEKNPNAEQTPEELRQKVLSIYHEPSFSALHKRLQASLQYGALSIPKDLLTQTLRLKDDVGLRKKFLQLWVKTYDLNALRAAAEAIIGRQIPISNRLSSGSTGSDDGSREHRMARRAIEGFLDSFLICNEDAVKVKSGAGTIASIARGEQHGDDFGSQGWAWRRTVLRSLMLILLLDKAKTANVLPSCLFQMNSPHKSSTDVLHQLASMLLPSIGDVARPLGHLSYKVEHLQYPLQEYTYHIENIAIDLRNGVVLTRLVELLLYPPTALGTQTDETVTVTMPTGELLTSNVDFDQKEGWVLSQHLKFPAIGRAQKLYNVQVALSALKGVRGTPLEAVGGVRADDVVDGHREKTLSLLWSLVGNCGLGSLVDWPQISQEIDRFRESWYKNRDEYAQGSLDSDSDEATTELEGLEYHKRLLLSWARCIARVQGLRVLNFTTSFSDGRIFEAIVDAYLPSTLLVASTKSALSLAAKLKATGCSTSFIALFADRKQTSIPSRDFTILSLSFLASRLLPLSKAHRAATTIQRAYRLRLTRQTAHKRVVLMRLAASCAEVAEKRNALVHAATVVQQRWRMVLANKEMQLTRDVELFQALSRGWAIRRWARRVTGGRVGGKEKVRRMRGGW